MKLINSILFLFLSVATFAQSNFDIFQYRNVGPNRGGRATSVAGIASEPGTFYLGATGGGVWKSTDYGVSWKNVSDGYFETPSIGDIAIAQNDKNIVYVGTGSDGLRSNVIAGKGVYKSIDAGSTWEHIGLRNVGQIGAVELHPDNHNIAYVAAIGNAFAPNIERGVYKTENGGKTWTKSLFISDKIGVSDIELLPSNPEIIFAAAWKAERKPWTIVSGGKQEEGGIYKSVDGGNTWEKITNGLPSGLIGKIDLAISEADSRIIYALVEAPGKEGGLYKSIDQGKSFKLISNYKGIRTRPFYYTNIEADPKNPNRVYVMATGYFRSDDGGKNWITMRPPHGDNHDMWINPDNPDLFIQANDGGANVTTNGGKTWSTQLNQPTAEIYQVEVDDQLPYWLYGGQQDNYSTIAVPSQAPGSIQSPATGWIINTGGCETGPAVPKPGNHNIVYANCKGRFSVFDKRTGLELSYDVGAANMYGHNPKDLKYRFQRVSPIHVSPHNPNVVYHTSQYVHKTMDEGKTWETISPDLTAFEEDKQVISGSPITRDVTGEEFYSTIYAIRESTAKEGVIWVGANDGPVHVTKDGGQNWQNVTPSKMPTGGRVDAVEPSPHNPAKAYIAVLRYQLNDWKPYIYKTVNFGKTWQLLTNGVNGIPNDYPTRVVREDPDKEGVLYAGTEYGMFISMDDGVSWNTFQQNLPLTPITDIKVNQKDLAISTMGRGFWILDNLNTLHQENFSKSLNNNTLFKPKDTYRMKRPKGRSDIFPNPALNIDYFISENSKDSITLQILNMNGDTINTFISGSKKQNYIEEDMAQSKVIYIIDESLDTTKGMHRFNWDMKHRGPWDTNKNRAYKNGPSVSSGKYKVRLSIGSQLYEQTFELITDPRVSEMGITEDDISRQEQLGLQVASLLSDARKLERDLKKEKLTSKDNERLNVINNKLANLKMAEGIYMQPMLIDQIAYLYRVVNGPDHVPNKDVYDRFDELKASFIKIRDK